MDKEYLLKKWLDNQLSSEELQAFKALENATLYEEIIEEAHRFKAEKQMKVAAFDILDTKLSTKETSSLNWKKIVIRIAAVFLIGSAVFMFWDTNKLNTINTDLAQKETIELPDQSMVQLNQLSKIEYNTSNWDEERKLELNGEAFFNVAKGKRFDVYTEFGKVSVLGTAFNVLSRESIFKVSCYEGIVKVTFNNDTIKLPAGREFTLVDGHAEKTIINTAQPFWLKNMSVYKNTSVDDVFDELEKHFDILVIYEPKGKLNFTGAFEHTNLQDALKSITQPLNLTYKIENNREVIIRNDKE